MNNEFKPRYFAICLDEDQPGINEDKVAMCSFEITEQQYKQIHDGDPVVKTYINNGFVHKSCRLGLYRNTRKVDNQKDLDIFMKSTKSLISFPDFIPEAVHAGLCTMLISYKVWKNDIHGKASLLAAVKARHESEALKMAIPEPKQLVLKFQNGRTIMCPDWMRPSNEHLGCYYEAIRQY